MATLHTKNAIVYLQGSAADAIALTEAGDVTINFDYDLADDAAFGDTWKSALQGLKNWSGSVTANFDTAQDLIWDAATYGATRKIYVYPNRSAPTAYYYGSIWPKVSVSLPIGLGKATMAFQGDGELAVLP